MADVGLDDQQDDDEQEDDGPLDHWPALVTTGDTRSDCGQPL